MQKRYMHLVRDKLVKPCFSLTLWGVSRAERRGEGGGRARGVAVFLPLRSHRHPNRLRIFNKDHHSKDKLVLSYLAGTKSRFRLCAPHIHIILSQRHSPGPLCVSSVLCISPHVGSRTATLKIALKYGVN